MRSIFVGRDSELEKLKNHLQKMLIGESQICFVKGDAGVGKTTLISEFVRRAQESNSELLYVMGQCNDITGTSDPYLPFRHILGLLTGDESRITTVSLNKEEKRLQGILKTTGRALVEIGPELVGTLIPAAGIVAALGRMGAKERGMLEGLEKHTKQVEKYSPEIKQAQIFMQCTALLRAVANKHPLIIALDDLQWVDMASAGLLFHLARELKESRILILGTYRPTELSNIYEGSSRYSAKVVLTKIFALIERYQAEVFIDLNENTDNSDRSFVDLMVDRYPNRLDEAFRDALYERTRGHALFTTELMAEMLNRGDLVPDDDEFLVASDSLDWQVLPYRVEVVIRERIERLTEALREILTIASVEGLNFTAQVVARICRANEQDMLKKISNELHQRHQLVDEDGEIEVGENTLSRYAFSHAYFHLYLYNSLDTSLRRIYHNEIAQILEELYIDHTNEISLQLAQHYAEAKKMEKATRYFVQAGESASKLEEFDTSREIFEHAINLLSSETDNYPILHSDLLHGIAESYDYVGKYQLANRYYVKSTDVAYKAKDGIRITRGILNQASCLWLQNMEYEKSLIMLDKVIGLSRELGNRFYEASALRNKGVVLGRLNKPVHDRIKVYKQSYDLSVEIGDLKGQRATLNNYGRLCDEVGDHRTALNLYKKALEIASIQRSRIGEGIYRYNISSTHVILGNYDKAIDYAIHTINLRSEVKNYYNLATGYKTLAHALFNKGQVSKAIKTWKISVDLANEYNHNYAGITSTLWLTLCYINVGQPQTAKKFFQEVMPLPENYISEEVFNAYLLQALLLLYLNEINKSRTVFTKLLLKLSQNTLLSHRWSYKYHLALAQAGLTLLAPIKEKQINIEKTMSLFQDAVNTCGWAGVLDDAILVMGLLRKTDSDNTLQSIEHYLIERQKEA